MSMVKRPMVWLLCSFALGICLGVLTSIMNLIIGCIILSLAMYYLYKKYPWRGYFIMPVLCLIGGLYLLAYHHSYETSRQYYEGEDQYVTGKVLHISKEKEDSTKVEFQIHSLEGKVIKGMMNKGVLWLRGQSVEVGQEISCSVDFVYLEPGSNPGGYDALKYHMSSGYAFLGYGTTGKVIKQPTGVWYIKNKVYNAISKGLKSILPPEEVGVFKAMFLGSKTEDSKSYYDTFKDLGILHVLAISGLHMALLFSGTFMLLTKLKLRERTAYALTLLISLCFVWLTGMSISACRAFIMFSVLVLGRVVGYKGDGINSLALSAFLMCCIRPLSLFQVGFQLSFGALLGIMLFSKPIVTGPVIWLRKMIQVSVGAFLITAPIMCYHFYTLNVYTLIMNILFVPLMSLIMVLGVFGVLVGNFWVVGGRFIVAMAYVVLKGISIVNEAIMPYVPQGIFLTGRPSWYKLIVYAFLLLMCVKLWHMPKKVFKKHMLTAPCFLIVLLIMPTLSLPSLTYLDVGQGDGAILSKGNIDFLIDAGPPKAGQSIEQYLNYKGIETLDGVFISHTDRDHIGGLTYLIEKGRVERVFYADVKEQENDALNAIKEVCRNSNVEMVPFAAGQEVTARRLSIECVSPIPQREYGNNNNASMVLDVRVGEVNFLFTGDLESDGERDLLRENTVESHVLKVAHHGSSTSTTEEFLEKVQPKFGIISCGKDNSYGHPHKEVVKRLEKEGIVLYNTSTDGAIELQVFGRNVKIKKWQRDRHGWFKKTVTRR